MPKVYLWEKYDDNKQNRHPAGYFFIISIRPLESKLSWTPGNNKSRLSAACFVERKTGLEPATPTLARSCSTN